MVVEEEEVVGEVVEVGEEVDGTKEDMVDMVALEDMVDTEESEDGTSINVSPVPTFSVSHELCFSVEGQKR